MCLTAFDRWAKFSKQFAIVANFKKKRIKEGGSNSHF